VTDAAQWNPKDDIECVLVDAERLRQRVRELGSEITRDYDGRPLVLIGVLKGAVTFLVDLARAIHLPLELDFMAASSYGGGTETSGEVRIRKDLDDSIEGKDVIIVEDIVDTGLTLHRLLGELEARNPASLRVCGLLVKDRSRIEKIDVSYVGFEIPDRFVVGYGLDYAERYRNLEFIGVLRPSVYSDSATLADR
jgi:hypoxanthine phosphoribosyltransferase